MTLRIEQSAADARDFNSSITPDQQKDFYLAGMNAVAEKFWRLARNDKSEPEEVRLYADLLVRHFEHEIKKEKNAIAMRHLKLLEAKSKALADLAKDRGLTDTQFFGKIREVFFPASNGNGHHPTGEAHKLLENGFAT
jgi:hypothetical protein